MTSDACGTPGNSCESLPFVGRRKEVSRLESLHSRRRHVVLFGPAGIGKSALLRRVAGGVPLLMSPRSLRLSDVCAFLERGLGSAGARQRLPARVRHLLSAVGGTGATVVLDGVARAGSDLTWFVERLMERVPVWIAARSDDVRDLGRLWALSAGFERVELSPFRPAETRAFVEAAVELGLVPREAIRIVAWLHRQSAGSPLVLCELVAALAEGRYDLGNPLALERLDLDRRIRQALSPSEEGP
ncbi:MAG TPA: hypothetical protein DCM87_13605 [Planctomycetes bacterium]|nr:hypothetical protein [Planctomycetota bacterium]